MGRKEEGQQRWRCMRMLWEEIEGPYLVLATVK